MGCGRTDLNGVWRVDTRAQPTLAHPMPSKTGACGGSIPNALAFDDDGKLYVTESAQGEVWRLGAQGAELWTWHDLLKPRPNSANPVSADGIAYRNNSLWVSNLDTGTRSTSRASWGSRTTRTRRAMSSIFPGSTSCASVRKARWSA